MAPFFVFGLKVLYLHMSEIISKELFIESIQEIEKQHKHDQSCSEAFRKILPNDHISGYDNSLLQNQLLKILKVLTSDDHKDSWIEYYIWELDFGEKYKDGCIKVGGKDFELKTTGDLWDLIKTPLN